MLLFVLFHLRDPRHIYWLFWQEVTESELNFLCFSGSTYSWVDIGLVHTCDQFKKASGRFSFHFRETLSKMYYIRISIGKFFIQMREISKFWGKLGCFRRNFMAHFRELHEDEGGITCVSATCHSLLIHSLTFSLSQPVIDSLNYHSLSH